MPTARGTVNEPTIALPDPGPSQTSYGALLFHGKAPANWTNPVNEPNLGGGTGTAAPTTGQIWPRDT